jgi:hypothetical protein
VSLDIVSEPECGTADERMAITCEDVVMSLSSRSSTPRHA